jgi:hypothetical protein
MGETCSMHGDLRNAYKMRKPRWTWEDNIVCLFNDAVGNSDYTASNNSMAVNNKLETIWNDAVVANLMVRHSPGGNSKWRKLSQDSRWPEWDRNGILGLLALWERANERQRSRGSIPRRKRNSSLLRNVQAGSGALIQLVLGDKGGRGLKLMTTHFRLVPRLRTAELHPHSPMLN